MKIKYALGIKSKQRGFTLIELMVVVTIVGILASVAYPSYLSSVVKSRRSSAQTHLMDISQLQQRYLLDARSYAPDLATLNIATPSSVSQYYTITICQTLAGACVAPGGTPPSFVAIATPKTGTSQASDVTLSIDNTGAKTPTNVW